MNIFFWHSTEDCLFGDMQQWQRYSNEDYKNCTQHIADNGAPEICGNADWSSKCCHSCGELKDEDNAG